MPARILFFQYVASIIEPFLKFFQSDEPFIFISRVGENNIFLSGKVHQARSTCIKQICIKMMKVHLNANRVHYKYMKIGIATTSLLNKLKLSEGAKIQFRRECLDFFVGVFHKFQERCSLKYKLTRAVSSLNPNLIYSNAQLAKNE